MLYLKNTTEEQLVHIPKTINNRDVWEVVMRLRNTISSEDFSIAAVVCNESALYYTLQISLVEGIPSGEYEYSLSNEIGELSTGLLVVGDMESFVEYSNEITYEQYAE